MSHPVLRRYKIRNDRGWAVFVIGSDGYFSVVSDYGNYAFWWSHIGEIDFREFLINLDHDYVCSKLAQDRQKEYQADSTLESVKEYICEARRRGLFTAEEAREEWELAEDFLENEGNPDSWLRFTKISDAWEHAVYDYPSQLRAFYKNLWKDFAKALHEELQFERSRAAV